MAIGTLILMIAMAAATAAGLRLLAPPNARWPEARVVLLLILNLLAVTWAFGAATLAAAGWARRRISAQAPIAVAAIAYYLLNFLASMWARRAPSHGCRRSTISPAPQSSAAAATCPSTSRSSAELRLPPLLSLVLAVQPQGSVTSL